MNFGQEIVTQVQIGSIYVSPVFLIFQILVFIIALIIGVALTQIYNSHKQKVNLSRAQDIINNAIKEADIRRDKAIKEAKEESQAIIHQAEEEMKVRKKDALLLEEKNMKREELIEKREDNLQKREDYLEEKEVTLHENQLKITEMEKLVEEKLDKQNKELERISKLTEEGAKKIVLEKVEAKMDKEIVEYMRDRESESILAADKRAQELLANAMQRFAHDVANEVTVTTVAIPSEDVKGRIIGREGRNIRTFEALTGVDLIIDDTPDVVVLSGFDPIRRETARIGLEKLIKEGRINPTRIEEVIKSVQKEMDAFIIAKGEETIFELGLSKMHPEIVRLVGCLHFRTSYGQSALKHSKEVAFLSGLLATEIGEDQILARRAGLLHDIGKAMDHEAEGSHVELGMEIGRRYQEHPVVLNAICSHHGNCETNNVISVLVGAADALSAARPGARSDSLENYVRRLEQLEELTKTFDGVESAFALQAGREVRVIVNPSIIDDNKTYLLAKNIKTSIEDNLQYPGTIKVVVIRETRATDEAK